MLTYFNLYGLFQTYLPIEMPLNGFFFDHKYIKLDIPQGQTMKTAIMIHYLISFSGFLIAVFFNFRNNKSAEKISALIGTISCLIIVLTLTYASGRTPAFKLFESFMLAAFILGCLGLFYKNPTETPPNTRLWVWLEIVLIFIITLFADKTPSSSGYDYNNLLIALFHFFRVIVVSLTLFSSALYLQSRFDLKKDNSQAVSNAHQGRNFLLLGAMLFLAAEYVGILWCLRGWGNFWHWSGTFFQSTLIVVFFMIAIHIPGSNYRKGSWRPNLGMICGPIVLIMQVIRSTL